MAEVIRVGNGDTRDVQYDYASEAERLWNDTEPTAPGPGGSVTREAFLASPDGPVEITTPSGMAHHPRRRWVKASPLLALGLAAAAAIFFYQRGGGAPVAAPGAVSSAHVGPAPAAGCTADDKEAEAAAAKGVAAAAAANAGVAAPAAALVLVEPMPAVEPAPRHSEGRSRRHIADRLRARRADAASVARSASERPGLELPAAPPGRRRLRPIDVSDPFAP